MYNQTTLYSSALLPQSHSFSAISLNLTNIFILLEGSIEYIELFEPNKRVCDDFLRNGSRIFDQHSEDLWIPFHLNQTCSSFLYRQDIHKHDNSNLQMMRNSLPLFYYIGINNSALSDEYTRQERVYNYLKKLDAFQATPQDFIIPASRAIELERYYQCCLVGIRDVTFLVVDMDTGKEKLRFYRDFIVPYYAYLPALNTKHQSGNQERNIFIYFRASLFSERRERFFNRFAEAQQLNGSHYKDIDISTDAVDFQTFVSSVYHSIFCLHLPGHTASSSRVFIAIKGGCIPVFVGNDYHPPYNAIINYDAFSITIIENSDDPIHVIDSLKQVSQQRITLMQFALIEAQKLLLYDSTNVINPVSLLFANILLERIEMCLNSLWQPQNSKDIKMNIPKRLRDKNARHVFCNKLGARIRHRIGPHVVEESRNLLTKKDGKLVSLARGPYVPPSEY